MSDTRARLFAELHRAKTASGLSYARMESRTPYSRASLERYVNGKLWPPRQAVQAIATACDTDPEPLLRLWDEADEPVPPVPEPPRRRPRHRWLSAVAAGVAIAVGVGVFIVASGDTQAAPPSTGCRDFYADLRAYTVGRMCWSNAEATISGDLTNPAEPYVATVQVCVSNHPNVCGQQLDLAKADRGQTRKYHTAVRLPPGHGTWIRVCLDAYCTEWK